MPNEAINPKELFDSLQYGFSQIVTSTGTKTIYLSGQVAWNAQGEIVGGADLGAQTKEALRNVEIAVQAAGGLLRDVVSMRIYFLHDRRKETEAISAALREFFPQLPPATTWVGVPSLADDAFLIEIEAVAVIG